MSWTIILTIILLGFIALIMEIFLLPGGIVGVAGLVAIIGGIVSAYVAKGAMAGTVTLIITTAVVTVSTVLMMRSRTWKKCELNAQIDTKMNEIDEQKIKAGAVGYTISRLAPTGKAVFDGETVEVASSYGLIEAESEVVVDRIEGNRILVKLNM